MLDANTQCSGMTCRVQENHCMLREWTECYMPMSYIKQQTALYKEEKKGTDFYPRNHKELLRIHLIPLQKQTLLMIYQFPVKMESESIRQC